MRRIFQVEYAAPSPFSLSSGGMIDNELAYQLASWQACMHLASKSDGNYSFQLVIFDVVDVVMNFKFEDEDDDDVGSFLVWWYDLFF